MGSSLMRWLNHHRWRTSSWFQAQDRQGRVHHQEAVTAHDQAPWEGPIRYSSVFCNPRSRHWLHTTAMTTSARESSPRRRLPLIKACTGWAPSEPHLENTQARDQTSDAVKLLVRRFIVWDFMLILSAVISAARSHICAPKKPFCNSNR